MNKNLNAVCQSCAACCRWKGYVLLTEQDITRLAQYLGCEETDFIQRYTVLAANRAQLALAEAPGGACIFLHGTTCIVYPARPQQCRDFPRLWRVPGCPLIDDLPTELASL